ncbi:AraC family transcriptional regulator [uncultured Chitinophaga sp.]|jgi:AraC-type DNA-binding domain-containing proteins|uniref:helix-turn-helix transcriptional regulator n=1 Tax=uncultured Chitinophaga sp. TaxID=339340 RepID=UPI002620870A|nr:AraC family transcriptional regulator [uncultured Chitinophaga sp.]
MEQQSTPSYEKLLLIERDDDKYTPLSEIPEEYLKLMLPYFRAYFYQDEDCDMLCQHIRVNEFSIWGHDILAKNYIVLKPRTHRHIIALHYMQEDPIDAVIDRMGPFRLKTKEVNLFSLHADFHSAALDLGCKIFSFHINVRPETLPELAKKYPELQHLAQLQLDGINGPLNLAPYEINDVCSRMLKRIFRCRYVELQAACFLYRCCVDLFRNFAIQDARFRLAKEGGEPVPTNDSLIKQVFSYVEANKREPLTLEILSGVFGISATALNTGFERTYATSLSDYLLQQRMYNIYYQLLKTKASLSSIAYKNGYPNRRAMVADFTAYFEHDPVRIRNAQ